MSPAEAAPAAALAACKLGVGRAARLTRPAADDSCRIAVGLIRGLAQVPRGGARAKECFRRRGEIHRGLEQVRAALCRLEVELLAASDSEPQRHTSCLTWASQMLTGLHTATRTLKTLEGCGAPEQEYDNLLQAISDLRTCLRAASAAAAETSPSAAAGGARGAAEVKCPRLPHHPRHQQCGAAGVRTRRPVNSFAGVFLL